MISIGRDIIHYIRIRRITKNIGRLGSGCLFQHGLILKGQKYLEIGNDCYFGRDCRIEAWDSYNNMLYIPQIIIGNRVRINSTCHIGAINLIKIGDDCLFGSHVMLIDHSHGKNTFEEVNLHPSDRDLYSKGPIIIGEKCWLGENVVVLPDVHIGKCSVVGANSVVTKDIPEYSVAAGNPARVVKSIKENLIQE